MVFSIVQHQWPSIIDILRLWLSQNEKNTSAILSLYHFIRELRRSLSLNILWSDSHFSSNNNFPTPTQHSTPWPTTQVSLKPTLNSRSISSRPSPDTHNKSIDNPPDRKTPSGHPGSIPFTSHPPIHLWLTCHCISATFLVNYTLFVHINIY